MAERRNDLPDECWELIFNRLDNHSQLEASSLACKRFLSITNRLRTHFAIVNPTIFIHGTLSKLFSRFRHLKSVDLSMFRGDLDRVLVEIAISDLKLEALDVSTNNCLPLEGLKLLGSNMKSLRVLNCAALRTFRDIELFTIAESMPWLEDLDISYPGNYSDLDSDSDTELEPVNPGEVGLTDLGIKVLSSKLRGLRKINISGNDFLTDRSLFALSSNCVLLKEIVILDCSLVTPYGIEFVMRNNPQLSSISAGGIEIGISFTCLPLTDSLTSTTCLSTLHIHDSVVPDEFLYSLAKAGIPLKRFSLSFCSNFSFSGISSLLCTYQSLEYLALMRVEILTDKYMSDLSKYLPALITIRLNSCSMLTESTFFTLAKNCPSLKDISMGRTNLGGGSGVSAADIVKNPRIKSLNLTSNSNLSDECLRTLVSVCPNLEMLDVSSCSGITEKGIANFLKSGSKIRDLHINHCAGIKNIGTGFELHKLEVLQAASTGMNDEGLAMIGNRCCGIRTLDLEGCLGVTIMGLNEILTNCKRLREINLNRCVNMSIGTVDWVVFSLPSLKKLVVSSSSLPTQSQRRLLLRHGCLVLSGLAGAGFAEAELEFMLCEDE